MSNSLVLVSIGNRRSNLVHTFIPLVASSSNHLQELRFYGPVHEAIHLERYPLHKLENLLHLELINCSHVPRTCAAHLSNLIMLRVLTFMAPIESEEDAIAIGRLTTLEMLSLKCSRIPPLVFKRQRALMNQEHLHHFVSLTKLTSLCIDGAIQSDEDVRYFFTFTRLSCL